MSPCFPAGKGPCDTLLDAPPILLHRPVRTGRFLSAPSAFPVVAFSSPPLAGLSTPATPAVGLAFPLHLFVLFLPTPCAFHMHPIFLAPRQRSLLFIFNSRGFRLTLSISIPSAPLRILSPSTPPAPSSFRTHRIRNRIRTPVCAHATVLFPRGSLTYPFDLASSITQRSARPIFAIDNTIQLNNRRHDDDHRPVLWA
jgi:hypothetical protein